jgi:hypothetical protein
LAKDADAYTNEQMKKKKERIVRNQKHQQEVKNQIEERSKLL